MPWLRETNPYRCARHSAQMVAQRKLGHLFQDTSGDVSRGLENVSITFKPSVNHRSHYGTNVNMRLGPGAGCGQGEGNVGARRETTQNMNGGGGGGGCIGSSGGENGASHSSITLVGESTSDHSSLSFPIDWTYAVEPVFDADMRLPRKSVTELSPECVAHRGHYSTDGCLSIDEDYPSSLGLPIIQECSLASLCHRLCPGRLVSRGLSTALEIFHIEALPKSESCEMLGSSIWGHVEPVDKRWSSVQDDANTTNRVWGWGVRTALHERALPRGAFVVEFIGHVSSVQRHDVALAIATGDRRVALVQDWLAQPSDCAQPELCLDARIVGNVARFIRVADRRRGEKPNLIKQAVLTNHQNLSVPRLAFFAAEIISPGAELLR